MAINDALVSWNANTEPDLASYKVYGGQVVGQATFTQDINIPSTSTLIGGGPTGFPFNNDGIWYFQVTATDTSNNQSGLSAAVSKRIVRVPSKIKVRR